MARDGRVGAGRLVGGVHAQATPQLNARADIPRSVDRIHPQALARRVSDMASATAVCVDTGEVTLWTGNWLRPTGQQTITGSFNNAAVGTALGIANGVQALDRRRQVIVMCGDGGFGMLMQEFATSVQHKLPVKVVVFNNAGWAWCTWRWKRPACRRSRVVWACAIRISRCSPRRVAAPGSG